MTSASGIQVKAVSKCFVTKSRTKQAVKSVSYNIAKGEVFGILGANGAGKTTLIKMMSTQLAPDEGHILIEGMDTLADQRFLRKRINVVEGGDKGLYPWLTGYENLKLFALLYRLPPHQLNSKVEHSLRRVRLAEDAWHMPTMTYSKGMKQRVLLAKGLVNDPTVLFLDEPTIGLDFEAVQRTREIIKDMSQSGTTVILTSHNASDIDSTCQRVALLIKGESKGIFPIEDLRAQYKSRVKFRVPIGEPIEKYKALDPNFKIVNAYNGSSFELNLDQRGIALLYRIFAENPGVVDNISVEGASLEDFYGTFIRGGIA